MFYALDDERDDGRLVLRYPYFEQDEPMMWDEQVTYTDGDTSGMEHTRQYEWNHGLGETVMAVLDAGLVIDGLWEHRGLEWPMLPQMVVEGNQYVLPDHQRELVPVMFGLMASKPA